MRLLIGPTVVFVLGIGVPATAQEHARQVGFIKCTNSSVERNQGFNVELSGCSLPGLEMTAIMLDLDPGWYVNSDNPSCGDRYGADAVKLVARAIAAYYSDGASEVPGETSFESVFQKVDAQMSGQGGAIASAWRDLHNIQDRSRCQLIQVHVPASPEQIRLVAASMHESGNVQGSNNACFQTPVLGGVPQQTTAKCPVGWSAIEYLAIESVAGGRGSVVVAMAKNWSADRKRSPTLHVWYGPATLPTGAQAPGTMAPGTMGPGEWPGPRPQKAPQTAPDPPPVLLDEPKPTPRPSVPPPVLNPPKPTPKPSVPTVTLDPPNPTPAPTPKQPVAPRDAGLIRIHNPCSEPVKVALTFQNLQGDWQTAFWFNLDPTEETGALSLNDVLVRTRNGNIYYYAESANLQWRGDANNPEHRTYVIDEVPLRFLNQNLTADLEGSYKLKLNCGG